MSQPAIALISVSSLAEVGPTQLIPEAAAGHHQPVFSGVPLRWQPVAQHAASERSELWEDWEESFRYYPGVHGVLLVQGIENR